MTFPLKKIHIHRLFSAGLLGLSLSACSSLGVALPGPESFTLTGELPADFSSKITATYSPTQREGCTRTFYSYGLGAEVTELKQHFAIFESERNPKPQQVKQQIPLSYKLVGCTLQLASVDFKVVGHYGSDPVLDKYPSGAGLRVLEQRTEQVPPFPADGTLKVRGLCSWLFQISDALARKGGIAKLLFCHAADEQWRVAEEFSKRRGMGIAVVRGELPDKTIRMEFRLNPEEEPSHDDTWVKFPEGWKPCLPKAGWPNCQKPPVFKTFNMNGRECTVYPNCTE